MNAAEVEHVYGEGKLVAIIVPHEYNPPTTDFVTTNDRNLQVGFIKYPAGGTIQPHVHLPLERHLVGTGEVLIVRSGKMEVSLFDDSRRLVRQRTLSAGDILVLVSGGHGFRMSEDTVLVEVKQGPYTGLAEKERFEP